MTLCREGRLKPLLVRLRSLKSGPSLRTMASLGMLSARLKSKKKEMLKKAPSGAFSYAIMLTQRRSTGRIIHPCLTVLL